MLYSVHILCMLEFYLDMSICAGVIAYVFCANRNLHVYIITCMYCMLSMHNIATIARISTAACTVSRAGLKLTSPNIKQG